MIAQEEYGMAYQREFDKTVRMLRYRGASIDRAEDLAQSAWLQGWRKLGQLRDKGALVGWINMIALNYHRRSGAFEARFQALLEAPLAGNLNTSSSRVDVAKILKLCRPKDRTLFEHQLGGLTTREMANHRGVSETAIRLRLLRARRDVRATLEQAAAIRAEEFAAAA